MNEMYLGVTEEETKPSYISLDECNIIGEPQTAADVGFANARHLINLILDDESTVREVSELWRMSKPICDV